MIKKIILGIFILIFPVIQPHAQDAPVKLFDDGEGMHNQFALFFPLIALSTQIGLMPLDFHVSTETLDMTALNQMSEQVNCPNNKRLNQLCMVIDTKFEEKDLKSPHIYAYQTIIMNGACANPDVDSADEVRSKIQLFWQTYSDEMTCNDPSFSVDRGNILKYGVYKRFDDFMHDVVEWGVDLNRIDPSDNRTVLDFIRDEEQRLKGTVLEAKMRNYYILLSNAGAKHRSEL